MATSEEPGEACAVLVAAGASTRMRGAHKLWADLCGEPLLARSLRAFDACADVARIVVVASPDATERVDGLRDRLGLRKVTAIRTGGRTRQASVLRGLRALEGCRFVAVHDAARPLVTPRLIELGLGLARERGAALCAVPARSTHKLVSEDGRVLSTPPRERLWEAQTPQVFAYTALLEAHERAAAEGREYTDDAALMEAAGYDVYVYDGAYANIKVTTPEDLELVRALAGGPGGA